MLSRLLQKKNSKCTFFFHSLNISLTSYCCAQIELERNEIKKNWFQVCCVNWNTQQTYSEGVLKICLQQWKVTSKLVCSVANAMHIKDYNSNCFFNQSALFELPLVSEGTSLMKCTEHFIGFSVAISYCVPLGMLLRLCLIDCNSTAVPIQTVN